MSEAVIVALVGGTFTLVNLIVTTLLSKRVKRVEGDTKATRVQVENNHIDDNGNPINLREEADERHNQNTRMLEDIYDEVKRLRVSVGRLWRRSDKHTDQIHELELTKPPRPHRETETDE